MVLVSRYHLLNDPILNGFIVDPCPQSRTKKKKRKAAEEPALAIAMVATIPHVEVSGRLWLVVVPRRPPPSVRPQIGRAADEDESILPFVISPTPSDLPLETQSL